MTGPLPLINVSSKPARISPHAVRLLDAKRHAVFSWPGPAFSPSDARVRASASCQLVRNDRFGSHGRTVSIYPATLSPVECKPKQSRRQHGCLVGNGLPLAYERRLRPVATTMRTPYEAELIGAVIFTGPERVCTIATGGEIGAMLSVNVPASSDAHAIRGQIVTSCHWNGRHLRLAEPVLGDALRLIVIPVQNCRSCHSEALGGRSSRANRFMTDEPHHSHRYASGLTAVLRHHHRVGRVARRLS